MSEVKLFSQLFQCLGFGAVPQEGTELLVVQKG